MNGVLVAFHWGSNVVGCFDIKMQTTLIGTLTMDSHWFFENDSNLPSFTRDHAQFYLTSAFKFGYLFRREKALSVLSGWYTRFIILQYYILQKTKTNESNNYYSKSQRMQTSLTNEVNKNTIVLQLVQFKHYRKKVIQSESWLELA